MRDLKLTCLRCQDTSACAVLWPETALDSKRFSEAALLSTARFAMLETPMRHGERSQPVSHSHECKFRFYGKGSTESPDVGTGLESSSICTAKQEARSTTTAPEGNLEQHPLRHYLSLQWYFVLVDSIFPGPYARVSLYLGHSHPGPDSRSLRCASPHASDAQ